MKPELGSVDLVGKSGTECVLANKWGLGLLSVRQDGEADPLVLTEKNIFVHKLFLSLNSSD